MIVVTLKYYCCCCYYYCVFVCYGVIVMFAQKQQSISTATKLNEKTEQRKAEDNKHKQYNLHCYFGGIRLLCLTTVIVYIVCSLFSGGEDFDIHSLSEW